MQSGPVGQLGKGIRKMRGGRAVGGMVESISRAAVKKYALQEFVKRERDAFSRKDIRFRDAKFKVFREMETHLLSVEERLRIERLSELPESYLSGCRVHTQELVARKLPGESFHANVPKDSQNSGQPEGRVAADSKHGDGLHVIAEKKRAAFVRTPPKTLFTERDLPVRNCHSDVGIVKTEAVGGCDGCCWRSRGQDVRRADERQDRLGRRTRGGRVLVFAPNVERKRPVGGPLRKSGCVVESLFVRPAKIVDDGLAEMIIVSERPSRNLREPRIDRFYLHLAVRITVR